MVKRVVRSTSVPSADWLSPMIKFAAGSKARSSYDRGTSAGPHSISASPPVTKLRPRYFSIYSRGTLGHLEMLENQARKSSQTECHDRRSASNVIEPVPMSALSAAGLVKACNVFVSVDLPVGLHRREFLGQRHDLVWRGHRIVPAVHDQHFCRDLIVRRIAGGTEKSGGLPGERIGGRITLLLFCCLRTAIACPPH